MVEIIKSQKIRIYPNKHNQEVFEKYFSFNVENGEIQPINHEKT